MLGCVVCEECTEDVRVGVERDAFRVDVMLNGQTDVQGDLRGCRAFGRQPVEITPLCGAALDDPCDQFSV
jgi:hypothetical protein